jgi:REP element-mobilizing transposase RayT
MKKYQIKLKNPIYLNIKTRYEITLYLLQIIKEDQLKVLAINVLQNYVHLVLYCLEEDKNNIIRKLKGKTTQLYKYKHLIKNKFHLWQQKYAHKIIIEEKQLSNTIDYVKNNHIKHNISVHKGLQPLVDEALCSVEDLYKRIS